MGQIFGPFWASKLVKIQAFDYFVTKFPLDSHQSCLICSLELALLMCRIWASKAQFLGHFGPQNRSKFRSLLIFSKIFHKFHFIITSYAYWNLYKRCVQYGPQRPKFWATLGLSIGQYSGLWSFPDKFSTGFISVLLHMLIATNFRGV